MAFKIEPIHTDESRVRQKRPRVVNTRYLDFIRRRPCMISGRKPVEAAHLRIGCRLIGKRGTGVAERPSDIWALPLATDLHREQHAMGDELAFWRSHNIDNPFQACLSLFYAFVQEDEELADEICREHQLRAMGIG